MVQNQKSKLVTFLLCGFLGGLGIHRFYTGKIGTGLLWLFTGGLFGVGVVIDMLMILLNSYRDRTGLLLNNDLPTFVIIVALVIWLVLCFVFNIFGLILNIISSILGFIF